MLKWFQNEIANKGARSEGLLHNIINQKSRKSSITQLKQMLATCYIYFLESTKYLQCDKNYLYGDLLVAFATSTELKDLAQDESVLVLLEMMRTCFPAGNSIPIP